MPKSRNRSRDIRKRAQRKRKNREYQARRIAEASKQLELPFSLEEPKEKKNEL